MNLILLDENSLKLPAIQLIHLILGIKNSLT